MSGIAPVRPTLADAAAAIRTPDLPRPGLNQDRDSASAALRALSPRSSSPMIRPSGSYPRTPARFIFAHCRPSNPLPDGFIPTPEDTLLSPPPSRPLGTGMPPGMFPARIPSLGQHRAATASAATARVPAAHQSQQPP